MQNNEFQWACALPVGHVDWMCKAEKVESPGLAIERLSTTMIIDSHVHVWEIDPAKYPVGITAANWTAMPDEPGTADQLVSFHEPLKFYEFGDKLNFGFW